MNVKTLCIDGDILVYQTAAALQVSACWGNDIWTTWANAAEGKASVHDQLLAFQDHFKPEEIIIAFSSPSNFRYEVSPTYKANRKGKPKPLIYHDVVDWCMQNWKCAKWKNLEADDVLGIIATSKDVYGDCMILTKDKDLRGIPATWCNMADLDDIREVSQEDADKWHMVQTLAGDVTDGYAGCPSIGIKTAQKLLADTVTYEEMWPLVVETFKKKGLSEDEALISARLARILRHEDYDFKKGQVKLWTPPVSV